MVTVIAQRLADVTPAQAALAPQAYPFKPNTTLAERTRYVPVTMDEFRVSAANAGWTYLTADLYLSPDNLLFRVS